MKKLLGLVAIALLLSFATVSVGWAAPAQPNEQQHKQGKEQPGKDAKKPNSYKGAKPPGKGSVKAPPAHNRDQLKNNRRPPAKITAKAPPGNDRDQVKNNDRRPHAPAKIAPKAPADRNRHQVKPPDRQPPVIAHEKSKPPANGDRHSIRNHEPRPEQSRSEHRGHPSDRSRQRQHNWHQHWPDNDNWQRHFRDWSWFTSHRVHNLGACYADDRRDRALYVHFQPQDYDYLDRLEARYGHCHYRERHHRHGDDGWCYYWFSGSNVIAFFVRDDGLSHAYIWQRDEVESQAVSLGILTPELRLVYSRYDAAMPFDLAATYTQDVLWASVDDEY